MKWKSRSAVSLEGSSPLLRLLGLALCFLGGVILGQVLSGRVPPAAGDELEFYLRDYLQLVQEGREFRQIYSCLLIYFRDPVLIFLLGFASLGLVLIPCVTLAYGCLLSFSVCCFAAAFGPKGVLLALAVFGLRCLVSLPVYFWLAVPAWESSAQLAALALGKRRSPVGLYGRAYWVRCCMCVLILSGGVCLEWYLNPSLLRFALERLLR